MKQHQRVQAMGRLGQYTGKTVTVVYIDTEGDMEKATGTLIEVSPFHNIIVNDISF